MTRNKVPKNNRLAKIIFKPLVGELDTKPLNTKNKTPIEVKKYVNTLWLRLHKRYPIRIMRCVPLNTISKGNTGANLAA